MIFDRLITPEGQLYYPISDKPRAPWIPELFGDAILVNGKLFPYLEVEPRKYRFRVLNASNARFYHLSFQNGLEFHQIGTDQGLLPAPIALKKVSLAPAERVDLVVDFSDSRGEQIVLKNDLIPHHAIPGFLQEGRAIAAPFPRSCVRCQRLRNPKR